MSASSDNGIGYHRSRLGWLRVKVFDIVDIGKRNAGGGVLADMLRYMSTRLPNMFAVSL
jgi:hypothetical protein